MAAVQADEMTWLAQAVLWLNGEKTNWQTQHFYWFANSFGVEGRARTDDIQNHNMTL